MLVKNTTGGHLPRYSVLGISGPVADPQSQPDQFRVVVTWGLLDLVERTSHLTCPTIDVQHGVFMHATWQSPLVAAATRAHELLGTTIVGVNEAVR